MVLTHEVTMIEPARLRQYPKLAAEIAPLLDRAVRHSHGQYTLEQVGQMIDRGDMHLWAVWSEGETPLGVDLKAVFTTEIDTGHAEGPVCWITLMGGSDVAEWLPLQPRVEDWAVKNGCTRLRVMGRKGWSRILEDWKSIAIVFEKELARGRQI